MTHALLWGGATQLEELDEEEAEPAAGASDFVEEQENVEQEQSEEGGRELE